MSTLPSRPLPPRAHGLALLLPLALTLAAAACDQPPAEGGPVPPRSELETALDRRDDPSVRAAREALADGRAFRATQLLTPALRAPERRTPDVVLLAATAAAQWGGWATVQELLAREPWLDARFDGAGRELLARAALGRDADSLAVAQAVRAVALAPDDSTRGVRLTLLARALDRRDRLDSAAATSARAAVRLPRASDWLRLRAAGVTADSGARARLYAALRDSLVRARTALVEAQARERTGDTAGAARAYAAAGEPVAAMRARLLSGADDAARTEIRAALARLVAERRGSGVARDAAGLLQEEFAPLTATEELSVARSLARSGPLADAARAYAAANRRSADALTAADHMLYGDVLFRLGRYDAAAAQYARVPARSSAGGDAAYARARAVLRAGRLGESRTLLRRILTRFPEDEASARALYLLADLATDERRDAAARSAFRDLAARFPRSALAPSARFRAAIIAEAAGEHRTAAREFDTLATRYPHSNDGIAALYWAGRAWAAAGDSAEARERWRRVLERERLNYYAVLAARRLGGAEWWSPAPDSQPRPVFADLEAGLARADELRHIGLDPEASREFGRLAALADSSVSRLLATAEAFQARGLSSRGVALGLQALRRGAPSDVRTYRTVYPVVHRDVLAAEAAEHGLDPALVAALIRQESNFQADARSAANARGLMQLLPSVGRSIARAMDFPVWEDALLYEPDVNVRLGTAHLASLMERYDGVLPNVLAAYNAGGSRVTRWEQKVGADDDPELFAERIPYDETRDYVRIVERNRAIYRALYPWPAA
ncbi:MAG TPA: transglycosylase SLT domain-containing protein [Gemmatimonadaceae bacterium]|nr:transglycosylase SLT domain-containing protein [Gemmatimonadaceae bacterium]